MPPPGSVWANSFHLVESLKRFYFGKQEPTPVITERTALLAAILFTVIYIAPFYLSPTLRTSSLTSRDAPTVIKARVRAVGFSCLASTLITIYVLVSVGHATPRDVLRLFAVWPVDPLDCLKTLALVGILFVAPLYEALVVDSGWRQLRSITDTSWISLPHVRNLVVAPWSEELVFRSLVVSLYLLAKVSPPRIVFLTPLIFGVAHVHHLVEFVQARTPAGRVIPPSNVLIMGTLGSLLQFTYTSLFGFFAAFVYLRTGNVFAAIAAHTFCNYMGLPRFWGKVGQLHEWDLDTTPDVAQGKRDDSLELTKDKDEDEQKATGVLHAGPKNRGVGWTAVYYALLVVGAYGFYSLLWTLTESKNALATF